MDFYLDSNGNASITEVWNVYLSQGTEWYRPYTKLRNYSISNFSVNNDSGKTYESLSYLILVWCLEENILRYKNI